uniref:Glutathione transferase n=1 Tax=Rhabditophanes sp. KR3021 TaxID=114890 RepID=A0AC35U0X3_9BILA
MVGKITLTYFDGMGRAEVTRILLHYGGLQFEDVRISFEQWAAIKDKQPFKQLPVLDIDGHKLAQSRAFEQLLASRFHLVGKSDIETALNQQYILAIDDVAANSKGIFFEKDPEKKKALTKTYLDSHVKPFLALVEGFITKNGHGHLVGSTLSYADIALFQFLWAIVNKEHVVLEGTVKALYDKVNNEPKIQKYLQSRPDCAF